MKARKPVWTDGLFMTQHHLQQQDRYHEALLQDRFDAAVRFPWGIAEVELDPGRLKNGHVVLTRLAAVFPDGTPVSWDRNHGEAPPPREIGAAFPPHVRSLAVHIGLPHVSDPAGNIDLEGDSNGTKRYQTQSASVYDYNLGGAEHDVQYATACVQILLGEENHQSFERIQVAELIRTQSGEIVLRDTYVPPILRLNASPFVASGFRRVLETMIARQRDLAQSRRIRSASRVEFQAIDVTRLWFLHTLNESIPRFSHLADSEQGVSAEDGYLALAELIGKLCTFTPDGDPSAIPPFRYLSLEDCFEPMFARAVRLIGTVVKDTYVAIPLERQPNEVLVGTIDQPKLFEHEFFVSVVGQIPDGELRDRLPHLTKIASFQRIGFILNQAVRGLKLQIEFDAPGALPIRPGVVFFRIIKTPDFWDDVRTSGKLAIYHPYRDNISLALYAVDPRDL